MKKIEIGTQGTAEAFVSVGNYASTIGSGSLDVYATPMMIALMEKAAAAAVAPYMEGDETTVGTRVDVSHISATPQGMDIKAAAIVIEANGREITFAVRAEDECGLIGEGTHKRFVVNSGKFMEKTRNKK